MKQGEYSIYFNDYALDLLEDLCDFEDRSKINVITLALEERAKKLGLRPKKRGRQLRARGRTN